MVADVGVRLTRALGAALTAGTCVSCTATGATSLQDILNVPLIRCDQVQWEFLGVSMAGWNAILSLGGAIVIFVLARKAR